MAAHRFIKLMMAALMAIAVPSALGQTPAQTGAAPQAADTKLPVYDVVSIKPDKTGSGDIRIMSRTDGLSFSNVSLKMLLQNAYGIREDLISGGPGWVDSAHFDIEAKVVDPNMDQLKKLTREQRRAMLLPLLADRFQLKVHTETKILPVYELVVAKGGPKLTEVTPPPPSPDAGNPPYGAPPPSLPPLPDPSKGPVALGFGSMMIRNGELTGRGVALPVLVNMLAQQLNRTVLDKTGLTGKYDMTLKWTPEDAPPQDNGTGDSSPSIFTALQEQLGLKLQPAKGPVECLVIDHAEMPTEN